MFESDSENGDATQGYVIMCAVAVGLLLTVLVVALVVETLVVNQFGGA
jgi:hypothetical protein